MGMDSRTAFLVRNVRVQAIIRLETIREGRKGLPSYAAMETVDDHRKACNYLTGIVDACDMIRDDRKIAEGEIRREDHIHSPDPLVTEIAAKFQKIGV